jgi:hypothetical protein
MPGSSLSGAQISKLREIRRICSREATFFLVGISLLLT